MEPGLLWTEFPRSLQSLQSQVPAVCHISSGHSRGPQNVSTLHEMIMKVDGTTCLVFAFHGHPSWIFILSGVQGGPAIHVTMISGSVYIAWSVRRPHLKHPSSAWGPLVSIPTSSTSGAFFDSQTCIGRHSEKWNAVYINLEPQTTRNKWLFQNGN